MKKIDFYIQTLLAAILAFAAITLWFSNDAAIWVFLLLFLLGAWQMVSCIITLFAGDRAYRFKLIHFMASVIYIGTLIVMKVKIDRDPISWVTPALILAVYYWLVSAKTAFPNDNHGRFLSHLSF